MIFFFCHNICFRYEITGQVANVVFLEGLVAHNGQLLLYYGTADSKIAVAKAPLPPYLHPQVPAPTIPVPAAATEQPTPLPQAAPLIVVPLARRETLPPKLPFPTERLEVAEEALADRESDSIANPQKMLSAASSQRHQWWRPVAGVLVAAILLIWCNRNSGVKAIARRNPQLGCLLQVDLDHEL